MRGVAIDNINQQVMTAGADCKLKVKCQLSMFNVCVYFGSKLNFFTRIRISSKMMQRKPSCDENILEQHQFWRYLSIFSTLFSPSSQNNYVLRSFKTKMLEICVLCLNLNPSQFRFHRRMQSYTELASVHGHVKARFPTISSVQSSFLPGRKLFGDGAWAHFLNVGW